jgi:hypothetical protein
MTASEQIDRKIADHPDWRGKLLAGIRLLVRFASGAKLADPDGIFNSELAGNAWRGITFSEKDKINEGAFKRLVRSAVEFNNAKKGKKSQSKTTTTPSRGRRK